jgi:hypothetical protein
MSNSYDAYIEQLASFPARLAALVTTYDAHTLCATPIAGEWSIAQNVHHLADSHSMAFARSRLILTELTPPLKPYDQDAWAALPDGQQADISASLAIIHGVHARWCLLFRQLQPDDWQRYGMHEVAGPMSLHDILVGYTAHGDDHIAQILRNQDALMHPDQ